MEIKQPLTTFECINFLCVASAICSTSLLYLMLLGPLFIVVPWLIFYYFKQKASYFHGWTWSRVVVISVMSYAFGLALATLSLYTLIVVDSLLLSGVLASVLIMDLIYSFVVFVKRMALV